MIEPCQVLVADPPWKFNDKLPGEGRGAVKHYRCLSFQDIQRFPLPVLAEDAYLFMWRVSSMVPMAYSVIEAWGFVPKTELVWTKLSKAGTPKMGMGHHLRNQHETCIVATRGRPKPKSRSVRSTFLAPLGKHSQKPEEFYKIVESFHDGPYVELFSRLQRPGWTCYGDELDKADPTVGDDCLLTRLHEENRS